MADPCMYVNLLVYFSLLVIFILKNQNKILQNHTKIIQKKLMHQKYQNLFRNAKKDVLVTEPCK